MDTVKGITIEENGKIVTITPTVAADKKSFTINFGKTNKTYVVKYRTLVDDINAYDKYVNTVDADYKGDGYYDISKTYSVGKTMSNGFSKAFSKIDYVNKTVLSTLTITTKGGTMKDVFIDDTFTNHGLKLQKDENGVIKNFVVKKGSEILTSGTDYILTEKPDPADGFTIQFLNPLEGATYTIVYTSDFNRNWLSEPTNTTITNKATLTYTEDGKTKEMTPTPASFTLRGSYLNNGSKNGKLNPADGTITWSIYTNQYGFDNNSNGGGFKIVDELGAGSVFPQGMSAKNIIIEAKKIDSYGDIQNISPKKILNGDPSAGPVDYTVTFDSNEKMTISFMEHVKMEPLIVSFTTDINTYVPKLFDNTATISNGTESYDVKAEVENTVKASSVSKSAIKDNWDIEWTVKVNPAKAKIENAQLVDQLTGKQIYKEDSFVVYEVVRTGTVVTKTKIDPALYTLDFFIKSGVREFTLSFKNTINKEYELVYRTEVLEGGSALSNKVKLLGNGVEILEVNGSGTDSMQFSGSSGGAVGKLGTINIHKVDAAEKLADGTTKLPIKDVEFELLNEDKTVVIGSFEGTDENGNTSLEYLKFGTYYIREIKAASGYYPKKDDVKVIISAAVTEVTVEIENTKLDAPALVIYKLDSKDDKIYLEGAEFDVKDSKGNVTKLTTDKNGMARIDGVARGEEFTIKETKAPAGYQLNATEYTMTITDDIYTLQYDVKVSNEKIPPVSPPVKPDPEDKPDKPEQPDGHVPPTEIPDGEVPLGDGSVPETGGPGEAAEDPTANLGDDANPLGNPSIAQAAQVDRKSLPKTSGIPSLLYYAAGVLLLGTGTFLRRKKDEE